MTIKQNIQIIKVPLSDEQKNRDNKEQVFPRMPRLYLELLENKAKIKQDLINKEYSPKKSMSPQTEEKPDIVFVEDKKDKKFESKLDKFLNDKKDDEDINEDRNDEPGDENVENNFRDLIKNRKNKRELDTEIVEKKDRKEKTETDSDKDSEYTDDKHKKYKHKKKYDDDDESVVTVENVKEKRKSDYNDDDSSVGNLEDRLNELLDDNSDNDTVSTSKSHSKNKYSRHRSYDDNSSVSVINKNPKTMAPSLAELEAQGGYVKKTYLRDVNNVSRSEQEEEDLKREIMFKFDLLRKSYPNGTIPEYTVHTDYNTMKKSYDDTVRRLSLDSTVDNYKQYLIGGFMACEFLLGNFFNLEMQGFTQQQILSMNQYEKLLIELGEKSYVPTGSKWPVEVRLLFMIIINAGVFVVSKMILKKTGANLLGMMNSMNVPKQNQQPKKKMKGPNIDLNNLPEEI